MSQRGTGPGNKAMTDDEVTEEFHRRKRRCKMLTASVMTVAGGLVLAMLGAAVFRSRLTIPIGIALVVIGPAMATIFITWSLRYWRCPACKSFLPPIVLRTVFCPRCGRRLR